jgi:Ran GTPase-activating protein (RanGAP) involved in mRNA processing and transport
MQTLTTLDVGGNKIGIEGTKNLLMSLRNNIVRQHMINALYIYYYYHIIQTLTTLDLRNNQIGDEGTQYLATILQHNTVRDILY